MTSTNKSNTGIILSGDVNTNEGQLGQTVFKSLTANSVMTPSADFESIYNKYVIDADGNYTLTLPGIQPTAGSFTVNLVQLGFECIIINNDDTNTLDILEESTGARKVLLQPGESAKLIAEADNGVSEDDWIVILNSGGNCFVIQNAAEDLTADDIVDIVNDGVIKANGIKLNNLIKSFGNVAPTFIGNINPAMMTIDSNNNIYYAIPLNANTTIGTDIRGNTISITVPVNPPFTLVFVKMTLIGEIIWYRECNFTPPSGGTYSSRIFLKYDEENNYIWYTGSIDIGNNNWSADSMNLLAHPYTGGDTASRTLQGTFSSGFVIGFDDTGLLYDFETIYTTVAGRGDNGFSGIDIDTNGDVHLSGFLKPDISNTIYTNSVSGNISIDTTYFGTPSGSTGRGGFVAKFIPNTGFQFVLLLQKNTPGVSSGGTAAAQDLFFNAAKTHLFTCSNSNITNSYDVGRLYTSGSGNADTSPLINVPAAQATSTTIHKIDKTTYQPVIVGLVDNIGNGGVDTLQIIHDTIRDQFILRNPSYPTASVFYNGTTTLPGSSVGSSTGLFIARFDTDLTWATIDSTDNLYIPCQDSEGNLNMFDYTASSITLGSTTYGSGGFIFAKYDVNGNYIFSRRLSGNDIESNFICPIKSINKKDTYYIHSGKITSNVTENGISLTTGGGSATQIFTYFVDSANSPLGIVVDDVTSGNPATICISGKYTMKNNTLIKGNDYFNDFGDITTNPIVKPKVGKAISTTDIILNLNK